MGAFILAGISFAITLGISVLTLFAGYGSTTGLGGPSPFPVLISGTVVSLLIVASHWLPHIGW